MSAVVLACVNCLEAASDDSDVSAVERKTAVMFWLAVSELSDVSAVVRGCAVT